MELTFAGVGSAFTTQKYYQSSFVIKSKTGKSLLIDCGTDARFSLGELGITNANVGQMLDGVYISHLHADHVGGIEWLGFCSYFNKEAPRPKLFIAKEMIPALWETLKAGLQSLQECVAQLDTFFDVRPVDGLFQWEGIYLEPVPIHHVYYNGTNLQPGYGLYFFEGEMEPAIYFSADTIHTEAQKPFLEAAKLIFHDCETAPYKSGVHASYPDLCTLPHDIKKKMWLYHYQPDPSQDLEKDGFAGFVQKGQKFTM